MHVGGLIQAIIIIRSLKVKLIFFVGRALVNNFYGIHIISCGIRHFSIPPRFSSDSREAGLSDSVPLSNSASEPDSFWFPQKFHSTVLRRPKILTMCYAYLSIHSSMFRLNWYRLRRILAVRSCKIPSPVLTVRAFRKLPHSVPGFVFLSSTRSTWPVVALHTKVWVRIWHVKFKFLYLKSFFYHNLF